MKGEEKFSRIRFAKQSGMRGPAHSLNHFLTASDAQSFQLPKLRHKFLTSKTTLKVDVIKLVLWENKIAFRKKTWQVYSSQ